jgi:FlaA1/EpsC-like NDP-sugar epimerase
MSNPRFVVRSLIGNYLTLRVWLTALLYLMVFSLVYWVAFLLRFDFVIPADDMKVFWATLPWVLGIKFFVFLIAGQYDDCWSYMTFSDLIVLVRFSVAVTIFLAAGQYLLHLGFLIPRSVIIIDCFGSVIFLSALRGAWRLYREEFWPILNPNYYRWALLVGTDHATGLLAKQMQSHLELRYRVRGFLATEDGRVGSRLWQIPILGRLEDVCQVAVACAARTVLVIAGTLAASRLRELTDICEKAGLEVKTIHPIHVD